MPSLYFFFFSSRRRHTRSLRDWSSDVCSSDLLKLTPEAARRPLDAPPEGVALKRYWSYRDVVRRGLEDPIADEAEALQERSEERRVGKECRSGGAPSECKKKEENEARAVT